MTRREYPPSSSPWPDRTAHPSARLQWLGWLAFVVALVTGVAGQGIPRAAAQYSGSYVVPFPKDDIYKVYVIGDSLADGVWAGLVEAFNTTPDVAVVKKTNSAASFSRRRYERWLSEVKAVAANEDFHIAVVMLGAYERRSVYADGKRYRPGSPGWQEAYGNRVDDFLDILKQENVAIYWLGLPVMRGPKSNSTAQVVNAIVRERALRKSVKYVDTWNGFTDPGGAYTDYGPDLSGETRRLRAQNGIHFTMSGYRKLAQFAERQIRPDLELARSQRTLPLAGDAEEQKQIQQRLARLREQARQRPEQRSALTEWTSVTTQQARVPKRDASVEYPADHSTVTLPPGASGGSADNGIGEEIQILRPAIPAAVVTHIRRRSGTVNADRGETELVVDLNDGETLMSTVTAPERLTEAGRRRSVPVTQTPYYKVLVKGETLEPRKGRADDFSWPPAHAKPSG